jgi:tight adherence protein B
VDIGFIIVAIGLIIPFVVLAIGFKLRERHAHEAQLENLMRRVGMQAQVKNRFKEALAGTQKSALFEWFEDQFKRAGLTQKNFMWKWLAVQAGLLFVSAFLIATQSAGPSGTKMLALAVVLPILPAAYVVYMQAKRREMMRKQFPEMLEGLVRTLQAGHGIDGALNEVAQTLPDPLGSEIKEIQKQFSLGINMRDILLEFQKRVDIPEARFFVVTLIIQRETGGQLTQILQELSKLMRRREVFQMKLKTMTAESRFTAWFLGLAPLLYLAYKYFFDYDSMKFFLEDPTGQKLLAVSLVLIGTGTLILRSMLKVRF